ncbi:hypothetical protein UFOVP233_24 [uncultured Caudovirales phage]|uniref:Uncharacterized protein n=1 Tax=uncultured Caudovirales phage TaxID=2100421 RepID=A0A6J7WU54_9CAUD|nr:hypothetical protein UFOVP233_24 [uncultured Caudovirales phage]
MWIFLNNAFLSVVDPEAAYDGMSGPIGDKLLVRARIDGDIEAVFPQAKVTETPHRDYRFRALVSRHMVALAMAKAVNQIGYSNFKGSVPEKARHDAYSGVWGVMYREQLRRAPARPQRGQRGQRALPFGDDYMPPL